MATAKQTQPSHQESKRPPRARRKTWSSAEEEELAELYGTVPADTLAKRYGVSGKRLRDKASHMGITNKTLRGRPKNKPPETALHTEEHDTQYGKQTIAATAAARIITHIMR